MAYNTPGMMDLFSLGLTMIFLDALILNDNYCRRLHYKLRNLLNTFKKKEKKSCRKKPILIIINA